MAQTGWKRALEYLGLAEPFDDYEDLPDGDPFAADLDDEMPPAPRPEPSNVRRIPSAREAAMESAPPGPAATPPPAQPTGTVNVLGGGGRSTDTLAPVGPRVADDVHVTSPVVFNDVEDVGRAFRDGRPVLMNLQGASETDAKRLLDFASGLIYGLQGGIQRKGDRVFLLVPEDVEVSSDEMDRLRDKGLIS